VSAARQVNELAPAVTGSDGEGSSRGNRQDGGSSGEDAPGMIDGRGFFLRSRARFLFHRRGEFYFVIPARAGIQSLFLFSFGFFAFRRRPPEFVIPAEAGIHLLLF
jgi:hypothetical protein